MSITIMSLVWNRAPLQGGALLTLLALADWANDEGECWPSIPKLATKSRQSARNVRYILRDLEEEGFVSVQVHPGLHHTNYYHLNIAKLQNLQPLQGLEKNLQPLQGSENVTLQNTTAKPANCNVKTCKLQPASSDPSGDPPEDPSGEGEARAHAGETMDEAARDPEAPALAAPVRAPQDVLAGAPRVPSAPCEDLTSPDGRTQEPPGYTIPADWWPDPNAAAQVAKLAAPLDPELVIRKFKLTVFRRPIRDATARLLKFAIEERQRDEQATRASPGAAARLSKTDQIRATFARALARHRAMYGGDTDAPP